MISDEELMQIAREACKNSYSPYSKFPVGAAVLYGDGSVFRGVNVENSSFGMTLCAERNAISSAVAAGQKGPIVAIAIYSPKEKMCAPCGACRQWIWEFSHGKEVKIILEAQNENKNENDNENENENEIVNAQKLYTTTIQEILPLGFILETQN